MSSGSPDPGEIDLFEEVVRRSGLAPWVGPSLLRRALSSVGVEQAGAVGHYRNALPELRARMAVYLDPVELEERLADIQALLQRR